MREVVSNNEISYIELEEAYLYGEDFSFFSRLSPINYSFLGLRNEEKDIYATMMSHLVVEISEKEKIGDKVFLYDDIQQLHDYVKYFGPNSVQLAALNYNSLNVKKYIKKRILSKIILRILLNILV